MKKSPRTLLAFGAVCALALTATGCSNNTGSTSGGAATLNVGSLGYPKNLDPANAGGVALPFFQAVYDNLVNKTPAGEITPMLATAWTWSKDNTELDLTLRSDVKFSDGTPFNAEAVKVNLERYRDAGTTSSILLSELKEVKVVDDTHAALVLKHPDPGLIDALWQGAGTIASPKILSQGNSVQTTADGSGPYTLDTAHTALGTKWVYKANPDYWGAKAKFDTITYTAYSSETAIVNGLKSGQIDSALLQQQTSIDSAKSDSSLTLKAYPFDMIALAFIDFNGTIDKPLGDARVRQAINYAINRKQMVDQILEGNGTVTDQPASPSSPAYDTSLDGYYDYNPAKAKQLLAAAGYPNGFSITMPQYTAIVTDAMATAIGNDLSAVGIKVTWKQLDLDGLYTEVVAEKKYSSIVFSLGLSDSAWEEVRSALTPTIELAPYADKAGLALIDKIRNAKDDAARAPLYQAFNKNQVEKAYYAPLYLPGYQLVTDKKVTAQEQSGMSVPSVYNYAPAK